MQTQIITESIRDYTKKSVGEKFKSLDDFLNRWNSSEQKKAIIEELEDQGIFFEPLKEEVGKDFDPFDLICHVAFEAKPLTRKERAENVKKRNYFTKYGDKAQAVINALLDKYSDEWMVKMKHRSFEARPINKLGNL